MDLEIHRIPRLPRHPQLINPFKMIQDCCLPSGVWMMTISARTMVDRDNRTANRIDFIIFSQGIGQYVQESSLQLRLTAI
jgi:hypothetical protein